MTLLSSFLPAAAATLLLVAATPGTATAQPVEVSGTLELTDGTAAGSVTVELIPFPISYLRRLHELHGDALPAAVDSVTTAQDGSYRLTAPSPGAWRLMIHPPDREDLAVAIAAIRRDLVPLVEATVLPPITLPRQRTLTVEVRDSEGQPVADAMVIAGLVEPALRDPAHGRSPPVVNRPAARTASDGIAVFSLPAGRARVRVVAAGHHLTGEDSASNRVRLTLSPGPGRTVEVIDSAGRPMPEALVRVGDNLIPLAVTDERGRATVGIPAGQQMSYQAETPAGDYGSSGADYPPVGAAGQDQPIRIVVEPPATVSGRLVDADTEIAVTGALVWSPLRPSDAVLSDRTGGFSLSTWTSERGLSLEITASGYARAQLQLSPTLLRRGEEHTVALIAARVLAGSVVDEGGGPIAGANLRVASADRRAMASQQWRNVVATTDASGTFRLAGLLPDVVYTLDASAEGFAPRRIELTPDAELAPLEIVLSQGISVWGRVVDASDRPLAGASVKILQTPGPVRVPRAPLIEGPMSSVTDADGRYHIESLPPGRYDLEASLNGFAPSAVAGLEVTDGATPFDLGTVVLERGAPIAGRVVDADRNPLPGATIQLFREESFRTNRGPSEPVTAVSAGDGAFSFDTVRSGEQVTLRARHQGLATAEVYGVRAPTEEPIEIVLKAGATLAGRVADPLGGGVAEARVQIVRDFRFDSAALRIPRQRDLGTTSDAEGAYEIAHLTPGTWRLWASSPAGDIGETAGIELVSGEIHQLDIVLQPQVTLSGRVRGPGDQPLPGATVRIEHRSANSSSNSSIGVTDAAGLYSGRVMRPGLESDVTTVIASHPEYREGRREIDLQPGENSVDLRLERGWEIRGRVVDSEGSPLAGVQVTYGQIRPQRGYYNERPALSDNSGRFMIRGLEDGEYQLTASKRGYAATALDNAVVVAGRSLDGVELVLTHGGAVSGRVIGLESDRLPAVVVNAYPHQASRRLHRPETGVDSEGAFRLEALAPGTWKITARLEDDGRSVARQVRVENESAELYVELEFESGFTLSGWVTREGSPLAGAGIWLSSEGGSRQAHTDHLGAFRIEALAAGTYSLQVQPGDGSRHTRQLELFGDDEVFVDLLPPAVLEGTVVDTADGRPLTAVNLSATAQSTAGGAVSSGGFTQSQPDGSFRLTVEGGHWELRASLDGYLSETIAVDAADGDRLSGLRIALSPAEAVTLLVSAADGQPVDRVSVFRLDENAQIVDVGRSAVGRDGRAVVRLVPPGTWDLWVRSSTSLPARVTVSVPGEPVAVVLRKGGTVDLTVSALVGTRARAQVRVLDANGAAYRDPLRLRESWAVVNPSSGRASIGPLPAGLWTLVVETDDGNSWSTTVQVVAGQAVSVVLE